MTSASALLLTGIFLVLTYFLRKRNEKKNLPPGPLGLPILGNFHQLGERPHLKINKWVQIYGKIFQFKMGLNRVVVISDPQMIREAFNDPRFSGRFQLETFGILRCGSYGVGNTEGDEWVEQRRFTIKVLKDLGFGRKSMEGVIMEEGADFMAFLRTNEGQPISLGKRFNVCMLNVIWAVLTAGNRVKHDDAKFEELFRHQTEIIESPLFFAPTIAKLFPNLSFWNNLLKMRDEIMRIYADRIQEHKDTFHGTEPRDFIDAYLQEIKATTNPNSSFYKERGEANLKGTMMDFFLAGPDTTSTTFAWAILYISKLPLIQKKIQAELDQVVGRHRKPTLADRINLPYMCATIEEVLRHSSILPIGVFRRALADVHFNGFDIPKGTWICHNHFFMQRGSEYFENPDEFVPERHLEENEKKLKGKHEANLPFSVGKRACPGEPLARDVLYLFVASIFQKYDVSLSKESENLTFDGIPGILLGPEDYKIILNERI